RDLVAVGVDDTHEGERRGTAGIARPGAAVGTEDGEAGDLGLAEAALGQAPAAGVGGGHVAPEVEGGPHPEAGEVVTAVGVDLPDLEDGGRHEEGAGAALFLDDATHLLGLDAGEEDVLAAVEEGGDGLELEVADVEERTG